MSSAEEKSVPLEGTQPIKPEETDVDLVPKPEVENGQQNAQYAMQPWLPWHSIFNMFMTSTD